MIRRARWIASLLLALSTAAAPAAADEVYDLFVDEGAASTVKLRLHIAFGGPTLPQRQAASLRLDAAPATQPYGESLTRALIAVLDRDGDGKLTKAELQAADKILLAKCDADEDECITPFELVPSLLIEPPPQRKHRTVPKLVLSRSADAKEKKPDQEITIRLDGPHQGRQVLRGGGWLLDVGTQAGEPAALDAKAARKKPAANNRVTLTVSSQPRGWFEILDANGDGQLSVPELRSAWERLADAGARRAGFVDIAGPNAAVLTLTFVRGTRGARGISFVERPAVGLGPDWFQAMDRNGDGYVLAREFIGTREQFRRFDRDGDGLLRPEEAEVQR